MAKLITKNEQSISWKELAEGVKAGEIALQQGDTVELKLTTGEIVFIRHCNICRIYLKKRAKNMLSGAKTDLLQVIL